MNSVQNDDTLFRFQNIEMDYEPYPIGYMANIFQPEIYARLVKTYPSLDLFAYMPQLGHKYSLSQRNNPDQYHEFLNRTPEWKQVYDEVKGPAFVSSIIDALHACKVDVGLRKRFAVTNSKTSALVWRLRNALACLKKGHPEKIGLQTRFEFSVLPADQGNIRPHTDAPNKLITLVISCISEGEWNPEHGGGTVVLRPKDAAENYNHKNRYLDFDATETLKTFPFFPNQCVIFVKTFNSLHAVHPMTGIGSKAMRKTLTINLELEGA